MTGRLTAGVTLAIVLATCACSRALAPGGEHYENLVGPYTQIGCGTYAAGSLFVVVQDFR